jgi:surfeit locus 1 family protein
VVLVDRGFVPLEKKDAATRAAGQIEGETTLAGVARAPQARGMFSNADDVAKNIWYTRDPKTMGEALKLTRVAPFYVEADATPNAGGFPIGGRTQVTIRNEHLQYAITWFGLAAVLLAVYFSYHWSNGRIGRRKND